MPKPKPVMMIAFLLATAGGAQVAKADPLFAGVWAESCDHGQTFTFHDGDRLKIVDLDCKLVGWKWSGDRYRSRLRCTLDGARSQGRVDVERVGDRLRITMGGLTTTVRQCP
ncbi:hypothetical protein [Sphingomonas lycopersici]|uniref:DUF3617 family protein n=1 Tax=Sphingomonas lycopersici TaxID=2951807 RepID=A0AA41ZCY7_9SPHN|nr:hypothetical protein [Sphingomonas lycopersici]MCW6537730.1 hypothetical protein [Sphingomonas lycopersici]